MNQSQIWKLAAVLIFGSILFCGRANGQSAITYEAPGAGTGSGQGTFPVPGSRRWAPPTAIPLTEAA